MAPDPKTLAFDLGPDPAPALTVEPDDAQEPVASRGGYAPDPVAERTTCHDCGGALRFDPTIEGETVGHLHRVGWNVCDACGSITISKRGHCGGAWKVASSGRSITVGGGKLRYEGSGNQDAIAAMMARIARLPDLEAALRAIARGDADPAAIARAALEGA